MPRTPLRRASQSSLFAASASTNHPSDLSFLDAAVSELADEAETLRMNVEGMKDLSESLATFNESFASWLYVMDMNALTIDWPEAPTDASFVLAKRRAESNALSALEALQRSKVAAREAELTKVTEPSEANVTNTQTNASLSNASISSFATGSKKTLAKPKLSAKEKKERSKEIDKVISCLPLEFRGSDPNLRRNMEAVIASLLSAPAQTAKLTDLISLPDLPQARVNKCLIALVNRKVVQKSNQTGTVLYHWHGII
ncbi:DASH complex subunit Dam1-domain-containing protein [Mycena leptocephala]|nr:DASH complex subunit Dam1-domain-containing protein [Mycena leptocephala]